MIFVTNSLFKGKRILCRSQGPQLQYFHCLWQQWDKTYTENKRNYSKDSQWKRGGHSDVACRSCVLVQRMSLSHVWLRFEFEFGLQLRVYPSSIYSQPSCWVIVSHRLDLRFLQDRSQGQYFQASQHLSLWRRQERSQKFMPSDGNQQEYLLKSAFQRAEEIPLTAD